MTRLEGKCAVVTGASQGIGAAIARRFAHEGARVVLVARQRDKLERLQEELGDAASVHTADLTDPSSAPAVLAHTVERFGPVDVLVNNAGMDFTSELLETPLEDTRRVFDINFFAPLRMLQVVAASMVGRGGSIVNITSQQAAVYVDTLAIYGASKGALATLSRAAAVELAPHGIRVNAIAPGLTESPLTDVWFAEQDDPAAFRASEEARIPIGRLTMPEEVAAAAVYLASDEAGAVTGATLAVDGGYTSR
jgi:NAD(P)-dependent dehydrogenase (short-subunit alcohol dehydrogenase family)